MPVIKVTAVRLQEDSVRHHVFPSPTNISLSISERVEVIPRGDGATIYDVTTGAEYWVEEGVNEITDKLQQALAVKYSDSPIVDAFGRLRVSEPETLFDSKFLYGKANGTYFSEELNGSATSTHVPADACINMSVSTNGDYAIRQTRQRFNYQPGKSQLWFFTGLMTPTVNTVQRIGCFHGGIVAPYNVLDGLCFEANGDTMRVVNYKGGVELQSADQENWSIDPMDGTGGSGVTVDWAKAQIFVIDYEWLGVGRVRLGVNINGITYYVHEFLNANNVTNVYMRSPNQPIRYEIRSTGGAATLKEICSSVQSEGGFNAKGLQAALGTGNSVITIGDSWELLHAIRLKDTELDANVIVENISTIAVSSGDYEYGLFWNPIIAGTLTWTPITGGALEEVSGDGATNDITPTITMWSGYNSSDTDAQSSQINTSLRLGAEIDGTRDVIALGVRTFSGTDTFAGTLNLKQLT